MIKFESISIKNYKSFGEKWTSFKVSDLNILIGRNNSGKTNILSLLKALNGADFSSMTLQENAFTREDVHKYSNEQIEIKIEVILDQEKYTRRIRTGKTWKSHYRVSKNFLNLELVKDNIDELDEEFVKELSREFTHTVSSDYKQNVDRLRGAINSQEPFEKFEVIELNTKSRLDLTDEVKEEVYSLTNSSPALTESSRKRITDILHPVSELLGKKIKIRMQDKQPLLIFDDDEDHPYSFEKVASGIQSLIIIFIEITKHRDKIILIDEPENHLHPSLQKLFLRHVDKLKKHNLFFIATHSSTMLDLEVQKNVIALGVEDDNTVIDKTYNQLQKIVSDLGYRPSDIVQANGVIWVEGPSDRIYMKRWLEIVDISLIEGVHYTFQFYGGALLGRLSTSGPDEIVDAGSISVITLNPNFYFVMDSDQEQDYKLEDLVKRQKKIIDEIKKLNSTNYFVTAGRTIENYLPEKALKISRYERPKISAKVDFALSKVDLITTENFNKFGLEDEINKICVQIKKWNSI